MAAMSVAEPLIVPMARTDDASGSTESESVGIDQPAFSLSDLRELRDELSEGCHRLGESFSEGLTQCVSDSRTAVDRNVKKVAAEDCLWRWWWG